MSSSDNKGDDTRKKFPDETKDDDLDDKCKSQVLDSEQLFQGYNMVRIRHRGVVYILRQTQRGKLILNK